MDSNFGFYTGMSKQPAFHPKFPSTSSGGLGKWPRYHKGDLSQ